MPMSMVGLHVGLHGDHGEWRGNSLTSPRCDDPCPFSKNAIEENEEEARKNYEEAAEGGHIFALNNFGNAHFRNGDRVAATRHWRLAASGGYRWSMGGLIACFERGFLHHADLAETLEAFYLARAEMKSEDRDQWIAHLKRTGKYDADCEC